MISSYITVKSEKTARHIVHKSVFIADIAPVATEKEAKIFISDIKKRYEGARHNCYAYIINENGGKKKSSDDGEPSGTAGRPILEVLENNDIQNAIIVVTRYFGGILLGAGGLVRAYSTAASEAVRISELITMQLCDIISVGADYKDAEIIKNLTEKAGMHIMAVTYAERVGIKINIPIDQSDAFIEKIKFNGDIIIENLGQQYAPTSGAAG